MKSSAKKLSEGLDDGLAVIEQAGGEQQVVTLNEHRSIRQQNLQYLREKLADEGLSEELLRFAADQRYEIIRSSARSIAETVKVGLFLIELKHRLSSKVFARFFDENDKLLPFGFAYAKKIIYVAEQIDRFRDLIGERFNLEELPAINVLYELSVLTEDNLRKAQDRGLLAPEATLRRVRDFKDEVVVAQVKARPGSIAQNRVLRKAKDRLAVLERRVDEQRRLIASLETP